MFTVRVLDEDLLVSRDVNSIEVLKESVELLLVHGVVDGHHSGSCTLEVLNVRSFNKHI